MESSIERNVDESEKSEFLNNNDVTFPVFAKTLGNVAKQLREIDIREGNKPLSFRNRIPNRFESAMLRRHPIVLRKVKKAPSSIHGNGVFATCDIKQGEIITLFPCHILERVSYKDRKSTGTCTLASEAVSSAFGPGYTCSSDPRLEDYRFSFATGNYNIVGHPALDDDPSYMGHFINDAAKPTEDIMSVQIYINVSMAKRNCVMKTVEGFVAAVVAVRDIKAGEEILMTYGAGYWTSKLDIRLPS
jgi:SET domain-containing protein